MTWKIEDPGNEYLCVEACSGHHLSRVLSVGKLFQLVFSVQLIYVSYCIERVVPAIFWDCPLSAS